MTSDANKSVELRFAKIFLNELNRLKGGDYEPVLNTKESSNDPYVYADVFARSKNCTNFDIQVKIIDRDYKKELHHRYKEANENKHSSTVYVRDLEPVEWAKRTLDESHKKYEPLVRAKLVLLLCVYHATVMDVEYAQNEFEMYQKSDFKGIYFINPKEGSANQIKQLISIKPFN